MCAGGRIKLIILARVLAKVLGMGLPQHLADNENDPGLHFFTTVCVKM